MLARLMTIGLTVALFLPALLLADDAPKTTDNALQGKWKIVELIYRGDPDTPLDGVSGYVFDGEKATIRDGADGETVTFKVDPSSSPKEIDFTFLDGDNKGKTWKGIYDVKDRQLRLCFSDDLEARPTAFASAKGSRLLLVTCERVKK